MAVEPLEHASDLGLRVTAGSLEELFCEAARGLFESMLATSAVRPRASYSVRLEAPSYEELLVEWLSDLLAQKELTGLVFSAFDVRIDRHGYGLDGVARGEPLDPELHRPRVEVKGISYLGLAVRCQDGGWEARFVVDV